MRKSIICELVVYPPATICCEGILPLSIIHCPLSIVHYPLSIVYRGPSPMQLVVVIAVRNAVSAATKTFAPISMILFFIIQRFNTIIFLMLLQVIPFPLLSSCVPSVASQQSWSGRGAFRRGGPIPLLSRRG